MSLRIIPIVCPGEEIIGIARLQSFGYDVFPQLAELLDFSDLTDSYPDEKLNKWLGGPAEYINDRYHRSLRTSWYKSLTANMSEPDTTIFAESDVWPCDDATADKMEKLLKEELLPRAEKEGYDVIRLFSHCFDSYVDEHIELDKVKWDRWISEIGHVNLKLTTLGTQALVVPMASRRKVANLFRDLKLPTDTALEYASHTGMIKVLTADSNVFMQRTRRKDDTPGKAYSGIMRRFLVCMTSYKRPFDLMRQIYTFMDQSYDHYHMVAIARGISDHDIARFIIPSIRHFIEEEKLTFLSFPHVSCFVDTAECLLLKNLDDYDYVCKVDDDDWYSRDYLFTINNFLNYVGDMTHGVYNSRQDYEIRMQHGVPVFVPKNQGIYENTLVYPVSIAKKILEVYKNEKGGAGLAKYDLIEEDKNGVIWGDGPFIHQLMNEQGCNDIGAFAAERLPFLSCVNKTTASFRRGEDYLQEDQKPEKAIESGNFRDVPPEYIIRLGLSTYRIVGDKFLKLDTDETGKVELLSAEKIVLVYDDGGLRQEWDRQKKGGYKLQDSN